MSIKALAIVNQWHPKVTEIQDADAPIQIEVTAQDTKRGRRGKHGSCAIVKACQRQLFADGVVTARSVCYLVYGTVAIRYAVPPSVRSEIIAYDRGANFAPGKYWLIPFTSSQKLGVKRPSGPGGKANPNKKPIHRHVTINVRAVLGGGLPVNHVVVL